LKKILPITILLFAISSTVQSQSKVKLNILEVNRKASIHDFFKFTGNDIPIISGHRGGIAPGFPENSIEALENTLKYTPAFFEIDPRLTKDSVIVLLHDATMERTTTGKGKLSDYTWNQLKSIRLKDINGSITNYRIPKLEDVINWARGKTILNLDIKDVPPEMTANLIKKLHAEKFVMATVHKPEQATFYYQRIPNITFSAHVKTKSSFEDYDRSGFPWNQSIAYIGPSIKPGNKEMYELLHSKGTMCMISSAPTYDKLNTVEERAEAYQNVIKDGADVLETDIPIEAARSLTAFTEKKSDKKRFFKTKKFREYSPDDKN